MSDKKSSLEPSMEEILASIRRILAEDERGARPLPLRPRAAADVLDLTEAIGEDGSVRHIEPMAMMRREPAAPPVLPDGRVEPAPPSQEGPGERLLSEPAAASVSASFARLAAAPHQVEPGSEPALDELVRETLRPMLQAWLDRHLPALVERLVQAEIARLMGGAGSAQR
jgi:cell pole-organizing protein PopZ